MIIHKIIRSSFIVLFIVCLVSPSAYALRVKATGNAPKILLQLRSELRERSAAYDYRGIQNPEVKNLVRRRELEIKDVMIRNFSVFLRETLPLELRQANEIEEILQTVVASNLPKAGIEPSKFSDAGYASHYAVEQIKEIIAPDGNDSWKLVKLQEALGMEMEQFIHHLLSYKLLFAGFDLGSGKRSESVVGLFKNWMMDTYFNPLKNGLLTASHLPEFREVEDENFYDADYFKEETGWNALIKRRHKSKLHYRSQTEKMDVEITRVLEEIIEGSRRLQKISQIYEYPFRTEINASITRIMVNRSGSVQPIEKTRDEAARITYGIQRMILGKLALNQSRVVNTGIVFYFDDMNLPAYDLKDPNGRYHTVPPIPVWVLSNGLITVNIRYLDKVPLILEGILRLPDEFEAKAAEGVFQIYAPRSELRKVSQQPGGPQVPVISPNTGSFPEQSLRLPEIPRVAEAKALGARSAFGIQAQDAFVVDASLIRNSYDMAVLLTVFSHAPFVVLTENPESDQARLIQSVNRKLPESGKIPMAATADEALLLLNKQKAALMRRPGTSRMNYSRTRILLSDQFSLDAAGLKKQIGDHAIVKVFSLDQFSKIAFGIVNRLELTDFASQIQEKIFGHLRTSRSA